LGRFAIEDPAQGDIAIANKKGQALLAYLALSPSLTRSRYDLAALLWDDRGEEQARHSLRQAVLALRKALDRGEASVLLTEGEDLTLNVDAVEPDVRAFERLSAEGTPEALDRAAALYRGDLLDGLGIRSESFDEWLTAERRRLRALAVDTLSRLGAAQAQAGDDEKAIETAQRHLALDRVSEEAHRALMTLYAQASKRSAALRQYQICVDALRDELDVEPEAETLALFEALRAGGADDIEGKAQAPEPSTRPAIPTAPETARDAGRADPVAEAGQSKTAAPVPPAIRPRPAWRNPWALMITALTLLVGVGLGAYWGAFRAPAFEPVRTEKLAFPLPEKPSIAVLPFENRTGDPAQENFVLGIEEGITASLSRVSDMFVIASSSTQVYKGAPQRLRDVAEELGVRYVVNGSVQASGDKLRVAAQLVDALHGQELWAETFEREQADVFALQDAITFDIVVALQVELTEGLQASVSKRHGTRNLQAWVLASQGLRLLRQVSRPAIAEARVLYERAAALDPNYPGAWGGLAWTHVLAARLSKGDARRAAVLEAHHLAEQTLALDPARPRSHALMSNVSLLFCDLESAVAHGERAVALNPNGADVAALLGLTVTYTGEPERAISLLRQAMRLSPYYPDFYRWSLGRAYRLAGRHGQAIEMLSHGLDDTPDSIAPRIELVAAYAAMGETEKARATARDVQAIDPAFSASSWAYEPCHADPAVSERDARLLQEAGLPE
jgi:TolB-like protein/DNA-binding SARP family transcriptional activator